MSSSAASSAAAAVPDELGPRMVGAFAASAISALVVTPLDVVKTRLQAQEPAAAQMPVTIRAQPGSTPPGAAASCVMQSLRRRAFFRSPNIPASALCPTCASMLSSLAAVVPVDGHLRDSGVASTSGRSETGSLSMLRSIVRKEGLHALWRGVDTAMAHSIPMNGIYMPLYDYLQGAMRPTTGALSPALAGMAARGVAVSMTAPIELIRTRQQAAAGAMTWRAALAGAAPGSALFTGLSASLARDVPFTALYWCAVEPIREALLPPTGRDANGQRVPPASVAHVFWANVAAGSVSGAFAAALTTPLDVVKTRMQTAVATGGSPGDAVCFAARPTGPLGTLRRIWQLEGPAALLSGIGPRVARAVPACAIVISTYEVAKTALRSPPPVDDAWWESSHQTVSVDE